MPPRRNGACFATPAVTSWAPLISPLAYSTLTYGITLATAHIGDFLFVFRNQRAPTTLVFLNQAVLEFAVPLHLLQNGQSCQRADLYES
jgi:hypothetical protein